MTARKCGESSNLFPVQLSGGPKHRVRFRDESHARVSILSAGLRVMCDSCHLSSKRVRAKERLRFLFPTKA